MFYVIEVQDYIRVEPKLFGLPTQEAVKNQLQETFVGKYKQELGQIIEVIDVLDVGDGIIIPGDGAAYYNSLFKLLVWKPELQELTYGIVSEITSFGAFVNLGVMMGMVHIGQTMEDYVSFSKSNVLTGKVTKRTLKKGDLCLARIVAISHKTDPPKIGLTMRQPGLGKLEWLKEDKIKKEKEAAKAAKANKAESKSKSGGKKKK